MNYFARLVDDKPKILYRATPNMEEQVWSPGEGWVQSEFLQDVIEGWGDHYPIKEEDARNFFPAEAFSS